MFLVILIVGIVLYLVFRGRGDRPEQLGAAHRPLGSGNLEPVHFVSPYAKCASCGAAGEKMKSEWDGMRNVKWSCAYCGTPAGVQVLKDEELPASARRRLGLDRPAPMPGGGYGPSYPQQGGGVGDLLTGMMIGSMMGGGHHHHDHHDHDGWSGSSDAGGSSDWGSGSADPGGSSDWGTGSSDAGGSSDWGSSDSGSSDWGSSDSGGSDWGGGDSGGSSGGDW